MKWVVRLLGAVVLLILVATISLAFLPAERIAKIATDQLRTATGRDVAITGDVALTLWPVLGLRADGLEVGSADWAEQGPLLQTASAAIGVDARSLLSGNIRITNIEAQSPKIRLEQRLDGRASWEFTDASGRAGIETNTSPNRPPREVTIERLKVTDATLIYDAEGSDLVAYENVDLSLDWPEPGGPAQITAALQPAEEVVNVAATIDGFGSFISGNVQTLRATVSAPAGQIDFDGRASTAGDVAGYLEVKTSDTATFLAGLGLPAPDLPPKLGQSIDMQTQLTLTSDRQLALRELLVDLAGNLLTGAADIGLNGVPQINARLDAGALDLSTASSASPTRETGARGSNDVSTSGWPTSEIDASALASFNGDIALQAESIDLGQFSLGKTQAVLRNTDARMVFDLREVLAYGGRVNGEFVINNRSGLSVGGKMTVAAIEMQQLLTDAIEVDRLTGRGDLQFAFLGSGSSVQAIMNSLSGNGNLRIARGTIEGINLDQLLRSGDGSGGTTIFDNLSASWTISKGVLDNRDLLFQLKNYEASGAGTVGLGARNLDYTFTPVALRANSGRGLSVPVRLVGPWHDVSIRPDIEAALGASLDEEKDKLEQQARDKVAKELGLPAENGQATEDALKDEIKDRLLRKLFD